MAEEHPSGLVSQFLRTFVGSIGLMFVPLPFGIFKRQMAGKIDRVGVLEFYSHPNFVCTLHLIWVGWLMAIGEFYNKFAKDKEYTPIPDALLSWPWIFVLLLTIVVMGLRFGRVQIGFLISAIAVTLLGMALTQVQWEIEIFAGLRRLLGRIPVVVEWGVPMVISFVLGILFVCVAAWRRLNDRWSLKPTGNYLEHENFQEKDRTISKGAKTFVAVYPCLLRRYLLFGFGDIEVRSSTGEKIIDRIEGVFFARHHAEVIKVRFGTTDTRSAEAEAEEMEDEVSEDEAL
jgi:hypothetical protein